MSDRRSMQLELISVSDIGFPQRCIERLEGLAEVAMDSRDYDVAARHFSTLLSLDPLDCIDILIKRGKARTMMKSWEDALKDADKV